MSVLPRLNIRRILPIFALSLALPALAWTSSEASLTLQPESKLWVEGGSTIKNWTCQAGDVSAVIEASPNAIAQVVAGEKGIRTVKVTVPAEKLECGNGTMNKHMKKALKIEEFPTIVFKLSGYDVAKGPASSTGTLNGTLTLGGVQKTIAIPAEGRSDAGALRVTGAYTLKMTDYDLTPPSLMFGRIKVRESVNVKFDLLLKS